MSSSVVSRDAEDSSRSTRPEDAEGIASIYEHYVRHSDLAVEVDDPPDARDWARRLGQLSAAGYPTPVATEDDVVVGYALLAPWLERPAFALSSPTARTRAARPARCT